MTAELWQPKEWELDSVYTEGDGEDFEVNYLFNSEPVKLLEVLGHMRTRVKIENSKKSKVLYLFELS